MARVFTVNARLTNAAIPDPGAGAGSLSVWVRPIWSSGDSTFVQFFEYETAGSSTTFEAIRFSDNNCYWGWASGRVLFADTALFTAGTYTHCALTWTTAPLITAYVNGVSKGSNANAIVTSATKVAIGNLVNGTTTFNGAMADFTVWTVTLSASEINALAKGARPSTVRPNSLSYWIQIEGTQSPEPDFSGNKNTMTITAGPAAATTGPSVNLITPRRPPILPPPPPPVIVAFKKSSSSLGARVGTRQLFEHDSSQL